MYQQFNITKRIFYQFKNGVALGAILTFTPCKYFCLFSIPIGTVWTDKIVAMCWTFARIFRISKSVSWFSQPVSCWMKFDLMSHCLNNDCAMDEKMQCWLNLGWLFFYKWTQLIRCNICQDYLRSAHLQLTTHIS